MFKQWSVNTLRIAFKAGLTSAIALLIGTHFNSWMVGSDVVISGLWCVISALLLVIQVHLGGSYLVAGQRLCGTIIGTIISSACDTYLGTNALSLSFAIAITIILCMLFRLQKSLNIAAMTVAVVMVLGELRPDVSAWLFGVYRLIDSILGVLIGMTVAHLVWPARASEQVLCDMKNILASLEELYTSTLSPMPLSIRDTRKRTDLIDSIDAKMRHMQDASKEATLESNLGASSSTVDTRLLVENISELYEAVISVQEINHRSVRPLLDIPINAAIDYLITQTKLTFSLLAQPCTPQDTAGAITKLRETVAYLNAEMMRFRSTHQTRSIALEIVEVYFSLTYSLKRIAEKLDHIASHPPFINDST
jgi:uncharacterized membrane protein YccC